MLKIDPSLEKSKITSFIKSVLKREGFKNVVIGMSGGVDSTTAFYLLKEVIAPENIIAAHLYYLNSQFRDIGGIIKKAGVPKENIYEMKIDPLIEAFKVHLGGVMPFDGLRAATSEVKKLPTSEVTRTGSSEVKLAEVSEVQKRTHLRGVPQAQHHLGGGRLERSGSHDSSEVNRVRLGNIMARVRMIILYDLAKKHNALVCGTENKSEFLLGYFTRFGDEASDLEPIQHLYKTQVYALADFLNVPKNIIDKTPTAGLWHGQTDEAEFGFSYKEANQVLFYYYDKKLKLEEIKSMGFKNAEKIIDFATKNSYKHYVPYALEFSI